MTARAPVLRQVSIASPFARRSGVPVQVDSATTHQGSVWLPVRMQLPLLTCVTSPLPGSVWLYAGRQLHPRAVSSAHSMAQRSVLSVQAEVHARHWVVSPTPSLHCSCQCPAKTQARLRCHCKIPKCTCRSLGGVGSLLRLHHSKHRDIGLQRMHHLLTALAISLYENFTCMIPQPQEGL